MTSNSEVDWDGVRHKRDESYPGVKEALVDLARRYEVQTWLQHLPPMIGVKVDPIYELHEGYPPFSDAQKIEIAAVVTAAAEQGGLNIFRKNRRNRGLHYVLSPNWDEFTRQDGHAR